MLFNHNNTKDTHAHEDELCRHELFLQQAKEKSEMRLELCTNARFLHAPPEKVPAAAEQRQKEKRLGPIAAFLFNESWKRCTNQSHEARPPLSQCPTRRLKCNATPLGAIFRGGLDILAEV